ncbi:methyltransferase domain-containing protein [Spirosoma sp. 48-14]|uniref:class I SAM-dependent methyltransferase n=1 Tax=Spirosoma sp. 48-14 TaxID=1895854 RepID=UPI0009633D8D|nr:methyltransferase domain-containing protein [Spirosoma sp. 48-14]OJW75081.1 MAG: hypothetical protein BGO59_19105 [Spirosoma sp. 48-14]
MKAQLLPEANISASEKQNLRTKLDTFYQQVTDYTAFGTMSNQILSWEKVETEIKQSPNLNIRKIRILEVGAGRSGFAEYLRVKGLRDNIYYCAQDVTTQNSVWLHSQADEVFWGDISSITNRNYFDIIFSTYVFEHVTDPAEHLEKIFSLLMPGGCMLIFCPRYDIPGYLCPSSRHINWLNRLSFIYHWFTSRLDTLTRNQPAFLIQTDLAAFYRPFFIDSDAVHWVSLFDLKAWANSKNAHFKQLILGNPVFGSKDWIVKRFLTCAVRIIKPKENL